MKESCPRFYDGMKTMGIQVDTLKHAAKYIEQLKELLEEPKKPICQTKLVFESNEGKSKFHMR